jgi:hypothetical protein
MSRPVRSPALIVFRNGERILLVSKKALRALLFPSDTSRRGLSIVFDLFTWCDDRGNVGTAKDLRYALVDERFSSSINIIKHDDTGTIAKEFITKMKAEATRDARNKRTLPPVPAKMTERMLAAIDAVHKETVDALAKIKCTLDEIAYSQRVSTDHFKQSLAAINKKMDDIVNYVTTPAVKSEVK